MSLEKEGVADWAGICRILTQSLKRYGAFHWTEIAAALGDDVCEGMRRKRESSSVWLFDLASIDPRPRRSILDYARVDEAELYAESFDHIEIGPPARSNLDVAHNTCSQAPLEVKRHTLVHTIDHKALNDAPACLLQEIVGSFYGEIALDIERAAYAELLGTDRNQLAASMSMDRKSEPMTVREEDPLDAKTIASAAAEISRIRPNVPFPGGLVCLASPSQAMQLVDGSTGRARAMNVGGIDVLATPVIQFDQSYERHVAFVVAKRSIHVALSRMEVDVDRTDNRVRIVAQCASGARADPKGAARIESWRR